MRVEFEFGYDTTFMVAGLKQPSTKWRVEKAFLDIPEINGADAPVAATWITRPHYALNAPEDRHVRVFGSQFYKPCSNVPISGDPKERMQDVVNSLTSQLMKSEELPPARKITRTLCSNRDEQLATALEKLSDLVAIDGIPYFQCMEPTLNLTTHSNLDPEYHLNYSSFRIVSDFGYRGIGHERGIHQTLLRPLGDYRDVVEDIKRRPDPPLMLSNNLQVLIPEAFIFDPGIEAIGRTVGQAIYDNQCISLTNLPSDRIRIYTEIRDDYSSWLYDPDSVDVVDLLDRTYAFFTSGNYYTKNLVADFLSNYDACQALADRMEIGLKGLTPPASARRL